MSKVPFDSEKVADVNITRATMQVQNPNGPTKQILTVDHTIMDILANCITLMTMFKKLSASIQGPAFICHDDMVQANLTLVKGSLFYQCHQPFSGVVEARPHGVVFLKLFKLLPHLRSYRQQHRFTPLIQVLLDVETGFSDITAVLAWIDGINIKKLLLFVCLERLNLAIAALQSAITTDTFVTEERSFYASVRSNVDMRLSKLRKHSTAIDTHSYLSVIDLFFHHERHPDSNEPSTFYQHQQHKTRFDQITQAVEKWIEKLRKRKSLNFFGGVVVSIKYSEVRGWYASAMLLFQYTSQPLGPIPKTGGDTHLYSGTDVVAAPDANQDIRDEHSDVNDVIDVWCSEIGNGEGKAGKPIYPYASIHTFAFLCPPIPIINSKNSRLYFFSANATTPLPASDNSESDVQENHPIVDIFDHLFLSQCFMKYKGEPGAGVDSVKRRMIRSYRL